MTVEIQLELQNTHILYNAPFSNLHLFEIKILISWEIVFTIFSDAKIFFDTPVPNFRTEKSKVFLTFSLQVEILYVYYLFFLQRAAV
jgi:hypothetical protein